MWLLPILASVMIAGMSQGGSLIPWSPGVTDLKVYHRAVAALATGSPYTIDGLPFVYPPIAAVLIAPVMLLPVGVASLIWTVASAASLCYVTAAAVGRSWLAPVASLALIAFFVPFRQIIEYGQIGGFLAALVVFGFRQLTTSGRSAALRPGIAIGIATAIKLTPALFAVQLLTVGRKAATAISAATFLVLGAIGWALFPAASQQYWASVFGGDNAGLGGSTIYLFNQSLWGAGTRILSPSTATTLGLGGLSVLVVALGLFGARRVFSLEPLLAVSLVGVTSALVSPVSWVHHFVFVAPLVICCWRSNSCTPTQRLTTVAFALWVGISPFQTLPSGGDVELTYTAAQELLAALTPILGIAALASFWTGKSLPGLVSDQTSGRAETAAPDPDAPPPTPQQ